MRRLLALLSAGPLALAADEAFDGRWNIQVTNEARSRAWWLEVSGAGTEAVKGKFVGAPGGQLDEIPVIAVRNGELEFSFERRYRRDAPKPERGVYRARLENGFLRGTFQIENIPSSQLRWVGKRAPVLSEKDDGSWRTGKPVELFNGRDLAGWAAMIPGRDLGWAFKDGAMTNVAGANNLVSEKKFWNFALHAEFRLGAGSNSGLGLRGRYEVQIFDDYGKPPSSHGNGALYSRIAPAVNASKPPGEWQAFDIRLVGRDLTVTLNGKTLIEKGNVEGLTAMAHDPNEDEPGPISLQGDHGVVAFRKLTVTPLLK